MNRWSVWAEILSWGSSTLGAGLVRISAPYDQKNVGHPEDCSLCKWPFAKERRRPDHPDGRLQQSVLLRSLDFGHPENCPLCKWSFAKERRRPNHPDDYLQQSMLLHPLDGHPEDHPLCKWPYVKELRNNCREEQLSRRTIFVRDIDARAIVARNNCEGHCHEGTRCEGHCGEGHWVTLIYDGTGQYRPVLAGIWWYWFSMGQYWLVLGDTGSV